MRYPAIKPSRFFDRDDIEELIQNGLEKQAKAVNPPNDFGLKSIKNAIINESNSILSELDKRIIEKIWISKLLQCWLDEAVSTFEKQLKQCSTPVMIGEMLNRLNVDEIWDVVIIKANPLQKLLEKSRDLFDSMLLTTTLQTYRQRCFLALKEQNESVAIELKFMEEFVRVLREEADEIFLMTYREIVYKTDNNAKFSLILATTILNGTSSLQSLAKKLQTYKFLFFADEFFKVIVPFFKRIERKVLKENGVTILQIIGGAFSISQFNLPAEKVEEIHLIGQLSIKVDIDVHLPGVNLLIKTPRLLVPTKVEINTTGRSSSKNFKNDAGRDSLGNGNDGDGGEAGESGGNIWIEVDKIDKKDNLTLVANGGSGSDGQNGGNGADGVDGVGMTIDELKKELYPCAAGRAGSRINRVNNLINYVNQNAELVLEAWCTGSKNDTSSAWNYIFKYRSEVGLFYTFAHKEDIYLKARLRNGLILTFSYYVGIITNCQSFLIVEGTEATEAKSGGKGGFGGQGGYPGSIEVNGELMNGVLGKNGGNGKLGKFGKAGENGWDIGWMDFSSMSSTAWPRYRGQNRNSKLKLVRSSYKHDDRLYCPYHHLKKGYSDYWMEIMETDLPIQTQQETSNVHQQKKKEQKRATATRKTNVNVNALRKHQSPVTAAQQSMASLQNSYNQYAQVLHSAVMVHQQQMKGEMNISRQVEFRVEKPKIKVPKLHSINGSIKNKLDKKNDLKKNFVVEEILNAEKNFFAATEKICLTSEEIEKFSQNIQSPLECDEQFLEKRLKEEWTEDFLRFAAIFRNDENAGNFKRLISWFRGGLDLSKSFDEIKKKQEDTRPYHRVIQEFVLENSFDEKKDSSWFQSIKTNVFGRIWGSGDGQQDSAKLEIGQLRDEYKACFENVDENFRESLQEIDSKVEMNKEIMDLLKKHLQEKPSLLSTCHLELIAQMEDLQLQFFEERGDRVVLAGKFNSDSGKILQIAFDESKEICELKYNMKLFSLEKERQKRESVYESALSSLFRCTTIAELNECLKKRPFLNSVASIKAYHEDLNVKNLLSKIKNCLSADVMIWKRLKFLTEPFIGTNRILAAISDRLSFDGCLLSEEEFGLFINTILEMSSRSKYFVGLILWIILSKPQSSWLTECCMLNLENLYESIIPSMIHSKLSILKDKQVIFLLLKGLTKEEKISMEELENIMNRLQDDTSALILKGVELKKWFLVLKIDFWSNQFKNLTKWKKKEDLQRVLHYLSSMEVIYGEETITQLLATLALKKNEVTDDVLLELFEALYSEKTFLSANFLETLKKQPASKWLKALDIDTDNERSLKRLIDIIRSNNKNSESVKDILHRVQKTIEKSESLQGLPDSEERLKEWALQQQNSSFFENLWTKFLTDSKAAELLAAIDKAIYLHSSKKFSLRYTQKIAILSFFLVDGKSRILEQVSTGEGKSLIVAVTAIIRALQGEKVDIITSSSVLARRDAELNAKLYGMFGLKVGHNCSELLDARKDSYRENNVVYGEISNFQRDYLLNCFYGENVLGGRCFDSVIVDEVDSMLLDKGNNVLYLSHQLAGFDKLEAVFLYIWQLVNRPVKNQDDYNRAMDTDHLRENVIDNMYKRMTKKLLETLSTKETAVNLYQLWNEMIRCGMINEKGRLLREHDETRVKVGGLTTIDQSIKIRLAFLLDEISRKQCMAMVPNGLVDFVERHLEKWIDNAKTALFMMVGNDYVVDIDRTGVKNDLHANITILDRDTGTDQASSQWEEGLHQFLQIKHGCKMSLMSLKAVFISNVSFFKMYKNLFGLTGTLGSISEFELLKEIHSVECVTIPTARGKKFYEETPAICEDEDEWIKRIYKEVLDYSHQRSILVICETVESVTYIEKKLIEKGIKNIFAYRREHEKFTVADGLSQGQVIVATNLAGRGTDIKISSDLEKAGGLHICVTYLPTNKRVEEQAFGRAARSGQKGSGRLIIVDESSSPQHLHQIIAIKVERDSAEVKRIAEIKENYERRIVAEEECFRVFQDLYQDYSLKFATDSIYKENLLKNLIDQWALWLDKWRQVINDGENSKYQNELSLFVESAEKSGNDFVLMPHLIKKAKNDITTKHYNDAVRALDDVIQKEPDFSEIAHYYRAFAIGKTLSWEFKRHRGVEVIEELKKAKRMFEQRSDQQLQFAAVVTKMKENFESIGVIQIDSYEEQKQTMVTLYNQFISSIDEAIGSMVNANSFQKGIIDQEMSVTLNDLFMTTKVLKPIQTVKDSEQEPLRQVCLEYGIQLNSMKRFLSQQLQGDEMEIAQKLKDLFALPNRDDFWAELLNKKVLLNSRTFVIIDAKKFFEEYPLMISEKDFNGNSMDLGKFKDQIKKCAVKTLEQIEQLIDSNRVFTNESFKKLTTVPNKTLLKKKLIVEIEVADFDKNSKEGAFKAFDQIKAEDFEAEGIEKNVAVGILEELITLKILEKKQNVYSLIAKDLNTFQLSNNFSIYQDAVDALLRRNFAYRIAFNKMTKKMDEDGCPFSIPLVHKPHQGLFCDLVEVKAIKPMTVDSIGSAGAFLNNHYPESLDKLGLCKILMDEVPNLNMNDIWPQLVNCGHLKETAVSKLGSFIFGNSFTITEKPVTFSSNKLLNNRLQNCLRRQMLLRRETTKNSIIATLTHLKGFIATLECPEPFLQNLFKALEEKAEGAIEEITVFTLNGMDEVIRFKEQAYTWKMIFSTIAVILMGVIQIAIGIAIQLFSVGLMSHVGVGFISEGVSDLIFSASAIRTGYFSWVGYWEHKKVSIMFTVITCGIGAFLARGAQVSRYGAKLAEQGVKSGGKEVASMCGKELIAEAGKATGGSMLLGKAILKDFSLNLVKGVAFGVSSQMVTAFVDNNLGTLCNNFAESFYKQINEAAQKHAISKTIEEVYAKVGPQRGKELIDAHMKAALADKSFNETSSEMFLRYGTHVSRQIGDGLSRHSLSNENPYVYMGAMILKIGSYANVANDVYNLDRMVDTLLDTMNASLLGCSEMLNVETMYKNEEEKKKFKKEALELMNEQMNKQIGGIIQKKFVEPLLQTGANYLVNYLGKQIKKQYRSYRNFEHAQEFQQTKKEYQLKKQEAIEANADQETLKTIEEKYQKSLNILKNRVRDPKLYADIVREGGLMDLQCAKGFARILESHMAKKGIKEAYIIEVEGEGGIGFECKAGDSENAQRIKIKAVGEHFVAIDANNQVIDRSGNGFDCMLDAFKTHFPDLSVSNENLREAIAHHIETDPSIGEVIRSGQHEFGLRRGLYGGLKKTIQRVDDKKVLWRFDERVDVTLKNEKNETKMTLKEQMERAEAISKEKIERGLKGFGQKNFTLKLDDEKSDQGKAKEWVINFMNQKDNDYTKQKPNDVKIEWVKPLKPTGQVVSSDGSSVQVVQWEGEARVEVNIGGGKTKMINFYVEYNRDNPEPGNPDNGPPHSHFGYSVTALDTKLRPIKGHIIMDYNKDMAGRPGKGSSRMLPYPDSSV